ncbi:MAG: cell wall-binding repeat-containing protein, partial [Erysipelotrichaceae bacterium]|nr:cell wall-binding repeat-containing protein [Erysipelotrichaceae bacterium]
GTNYADSLAASATGLPMLLVNGKNTSLNDGQRSFLSSHSSNTFYIIGGTGAVSSDIETDISSINSVRRLSGRLRFDTSVLIAETFFSDPDKVILSYSHNFPDGLSGGPLAYALKSPVLLTRKNSEKAALDYVSSHSIKSGYLCGGEGVLPDTTARIIFSLPEDQEIEKR